MPIASSCCATEPVVGELGRGEIAHDAMIRLMIGRDLKSLYIAARRARRPERARHARPAHAEPIPSRRQPCPAQRRDPRPCRARRLGANRAGARDFRDRSAARRRAPPATATDRRSAHRATPSIAASISCPRTGSERASSSTFDMAANVSLAESRILRQRLCSSTASRRRDDRRSAQAAHAEHQGALGRDRRSARFPAAISRRSCSRSWLSMKPQVMLFDEPTRGIDVGAKSEIYDLMRAARRRGRRHPDDLERHGGGDRRQRPHCW